MLKFNFFALALLLASGFAQASLIVNGSFEDDNIRANSWKAFSAGTVTGWEGSNMELWDNFRKFIAYDGDQYAELNAGGENGAYSIFQSVSTIQGAVYDVSFAYAARSSTNESFLFEVIDASNQTLFSQIIDDHAVKMWSVFETSVTALSEITLFRFTSISGGTVGNLVDAITVTSEDAFLTVTSPFVVSTTDTTFALTSAVSVSEPTTGLLMAFLAGCLLRRKVKC